MARIPVPGIKVRWLLAILIIGALLAVGLTYYNRFQAEQESLLAAIAQSNKTIESLRAVNLSGIQTEVDELRIRANNASSRESSLTQRYRGYTHSIEIQERLYRAATEAGVTITSLTCDGPKAEEAGGIRFESYMVNVNATADVPPSLLNFLLKVSGYYESGAISAVTMSLPRPPTEGTTTAKSTMSFTLRVVYIPQEAA
jgi:type II secretory pathway pseudopilin PulG